MLGRIHFENRAALALLTILCLALSMIAIGSASTANATLVPPEEVGGNPTCGDLGPWAEVLRVEPVSTGTYSGSNGELISIEVVNTSNGPTLRWNSDTPMAAVFVKGGNGGNLYDYSEVGATSDVGLHAPANSSGSWAGLSHVSFCVLSSPTTTVGPTTTQDTTTTIGPTSTLGPTTTQAPTTTEEVSNTTETTEAPTTTEEVSATTETTDTTDTTVSSETSTTTDDSAGAEQSTTSSIEDEVAGITVLPFTGLEAEGFGSLALAVIATGILTLVAARSIEL